MGHSIKWSEVAVVTFESKVGTSIFEGPTENKIFIKKKEENEEEEMEWMLEDENNK